MQKSALYTLLILFFTVAVGFDPVAADQTDRFRAGLLKRIYSDDHGISSHAMTNMARSYCWDSGPVDYVRAYMWFTLSVARHSPETFYATQGHKKIIPRMTPQQIEKARQMARQWIQAYWEKAPGGVAQADIKALQRRLAAGDDLALDEIVRRAEFGDQAARVELGTIYWEGRALKPDLKKALNWWTRVAEQGNAEIMTKLGILYSNGHPGQGLAADPRKGEVWLLRAATKHYSPAAQLLTRMYRDGNGSVPADPDKYRYWDQKCDEAAARKAED